MTWTISCPAPPCGSTSAPSSLSGIPVTYTAPAPPANDLQVMVTATSVANSDAVASALVTVPAIVVDVEPQNPDPVLATKTMQFTVTVTNDPNNAGVTWSVSCSATACGSVSPSSTLSPGSVTYTAPAAPLERPGCFRNCDLRDKFGEFFTGNGDRSGHHCVCNYSAEWNCPNHRNAAVHFDRQ